MVDIVVQPPSTIGKDIPVFFSIAPAAGEMAPVIKLISHRHSGKRHTKSDTG